MSSYIDHHAKGFSQAGLNPLVHSWSDFTRSRLVWLYGEAEGLRRFRMTDPRSAADLASWRSLGERSAA